jgi:hypothetical protein
MQYLSRELLAWCLILLGAAFLAKAIATRGQKWAMKELLGLPVDKLKAFRSRYEQRMEAIFGFGLIFLGVVFHLYILLRRSADAKDAREAYGHVATYLGLTIGAMALLALGIHAACKFVSKKSFVEILSYLVVRYRYHIDDDEGLLKELGEILGVEHRDDDTVETYAQRVEDRMGLEKVRARLTAKHKPIELR